MNRRLTHRRSHRKGTMVPLLVVCLITLLLVAAWVIDRAWVSSAYAELVVATESAAHAAAGELLDDTRLMDVGDELRIRRAKFSAVQAAAANRVAGRPLAIDADQDVRFAKTAAGEFLPDVVDPYAVRVTAGRTAARGSALGLLLSSLGGVDETDISYGVTVRVENRLTGIHAGPAKPIAMLPIGIVADGTEDCDGWNEMIVENLGDDRYAFDRDKHTVSETPDGLPEIAVVIDATPDANGQFVSVDGFGEKTLRSIIDDGHTAGPVEFTALNRFTTSASPVPAVVTAMGGENTLGRERVIFLTESNQVTSVVAGRVMAVETDDLGRPVLIIQPCVMTLAQATTVDTSRALPNDNIAATDVEPNPYLFKLITVR